MRADTVRKLLLLAGDFQTQLFANFFFLVILSEELILLFTVEDEIPRFVSNDFIVIGLF